MPAPSNPSNFLPSRTFQLRPPPQQDMSGAGGNRQGGNQIYNPFAPTAAQRTETDPEYEDLMASVGVK
jgi:splicing factor 1